MRYITWVALRWVGCWLAFAVVFSLSFLIMPFMGLTDGNAADGEHVAEWAGWMTIGVLSYGHWVATFLTAPAFIALPVARMLSKDPFQTAAWLYIAIATVAGAGLSVVGTSNAIPPESTWDKTFLLLGAAMLGAIISFVLVALGNFLGSLAWLPRKGN